MNAHSTSTARDPFDYDPLAYLPRTEIMRLPKRRVIYDRHQTSSRIYAVVFGRVKLSSTDDNGNELVTRIVARDQLFGESALIGDCPSEAAVALDSVGLFSWQISDVEARIEREPRLGVALMRCAAERTTSLARRIHVATAYNRPERVSIALLELAASLGTRLPDGGMRLLALTHQTIAEYVGTARQIVTSHLNRLKSQGLVRYTRKHIDVYVPGIESELLMQRTAPRRRIRRDHLDPQLADGPYKLSHASASGGGCLIDGR